MNRKCVHLGNQICLTETIFKGCNDETKRNIGRQLIQLAVNSFEGKEISDNALEKLYPLAGSRDAVQELFASIYQVMKAYFRTPAGTIKPDILTEELKDLRFPEVMITDLTNVLLGPKRETIDRTLSCDTMFPKLKSFRWRINITISSNVLSRVLEPSIIAEMIFTNGDVKIFEMTIAKFHELRFCIATLLKEMESLEKKKLFKN